MIDLDFSRSHPRPRLLPGTLAVTMLRTREGRPQHGSAFEASE